MDSRMHLSHLILFSDREETQKRTGLLTHFVEAGEACGHGSMLGGLAQVGGTGGPHLTALPQRLQSTGENTHTHWS